MIEDNWRPDNFSWSETITRLRQFNNDILIAVWVGPDIKKSDDNIVTFDQSDLMLPSAEYYQHGFDHPIIKTYYNILVQVSVLLGADGETAKQDMKNLILFEMELANIMIPPHERRNYSEIYNKISLKKLQQEIPGFNFSNYLEALLPRELAADEEIVMYALPYFKKLTFLVESSDQR